MIGGTGKERGQNLATLKKGKDRKSIQNILKKKKKKRSDQTVAS